MQKTLKGGFVKSKTTAGEATDATSIAVVTGNGPSDGEQSHDSSLKSLHSPKESHDANQNTCDLDSELVSDEITGGGAESSLSGAQKLANFAFQSTHNADVQS